MKHIHGMASLGRNHFCFNVKDFLNCLRAKDFLLRAFCDYKPCLKKNESSDVPRYKIEVVRRNDYGLSFAREGFAQLKYIQRVMDIEVCRRLIQEDKFRFDDETTSDQHPLPLAAGKSVDCAIDQMSDVTIFCRRVYGVVIGLGLWGEPSAMGVTSHGENLTYRECKINLRFLRNKSYTAGYFLAGETVDRVAIQQHFPIIGAPEAGE